MQIFRMHACDVCDVCDVCMYACMHARMCKYVMVHICSHPRPHLHISRPLNLELAASFGPQPWLDPFGPRILSWALVKGCYLNYHNGGSVMNNMLSL